MQLTIDASGIIYGTAGNGGSATKCFQGCGAFFRLTPPSGKGKWQETILHSFAGAPDGTAPSSLILAPSRTFYGETAAGGRSSACGSAGCGTIYALKPSRGSRWTETVVHSFRARGAPKDDGEFPFGGLALTSNGDPIRSDGIRWPSAALLYARISLVRVRHVFPPKARARKANGVD